MCGSSDGYDEIMLSWTRVTDATAYRLYQTTDATFVQAGNSDPSQFSVYSPAATSIDTTATSITMTLSGAATVYYVVTAINGSAESLSNPIPVAATAHAFKFSQVTSSTGQVWMDRNLGASQVATSSTDPASYGDLYQWGRPADGHQKRKSATTATLAIAKSASLHNATTSNWQLQYRVKSTYCSTISRIPNIYFCL
jgi:hypothetical protein